MKPITIQPHQNLRGVVLVPGDKSISHRAAILAAVARGRTQIDNFLFSDDCLTTLKVLTALGVGVRVDKKQKRVTIVSGGVLKPPAGSLFMGESGTSARVLLGLLAGQPFYSRFTAAPSLSKRPMARVIEPLRLMGAQIKAQRRGEDEFLPLEVSPAELRAIEWRQKIASAQVKSAILLAGLAAQGRTVVLEPVVSRDHTERMLKFFGADIKTRASKISIAKSRLVSPGKIFIPGDISSAAFFIAAGILVKGSRILIKDVGVNRTRQGVIVCLKRMGAAIKVVKKRESFEPTADIEVCSSVLRATVIEKAEIPCLIDELPILMTAASLARGKTIIKGVKELRVKETDRVGSMVYNLTKLGAKIKVKSLKDDEAVEITGVKTFKGAALKSFHDHRTAMSMFVAALTAQGGSILDDTSCIAKSFPGFLPAFEILFSGQITY